MRMSKRVGLGVMTFALVFVDTLFVVVAILVVKCGFDESCYVEIIETPVRVTSVVGLAGAVAGSLGALVFVYTRRCGARRVGESR